jgi:VIT1/CCC1 family predicted Fe2+/Mn2+ transporter
VTRRRVAASGRRSAAHGESHRSRRAGWLRAAVLGAGLAGLVAGAMSMATGEYVSVSSQRDALVCHGQPRTLTVP